MAIRPRKGAILAKIQTQEGQFEAPDPAADGILAEIPEPTFNAGTEQTNEMTPSLDSSAPIVGGIQVQVPVPVFLKGAGEPGVLPEYDALLRIANFVPTVTSTDITGTDISFDGANGKILAATTDITALTVGTAFWVTGAATAGNNSEFLVTATAAGEVTVTKPDGSAPQLNNEDAGAEVTLRYGVAGVSATGGSETTFTAQAPWADSDGLYQAMPVLLSGNPSTPAWNFLTDYTTGRVAELAEAPGAALDANTVASIPPNVVYAPTSPDTDAQPRASVELYFDGRVFRLVDCVASPTFTFQAAGVVRAQFQLRGLLHETTDAPIPSGIAYDGSKPGVFRNGRMTINRRKAALNTFSLETGNEIVFPDDPNREAGFGAPLIVARSMTGSVDPQMAKTATRDLLSAFRNGARQPLHGRALGGQARFPGNRVAQTVPRAVYTGHGFQQRNQLAVESMNYAAEGDDSGGFITLY